MVWSGSFARISPGMSCHAIWAGRDAVSTVFLKDVGESFGELFGDSLGEDFGEAFGEVFVEPQDFFDFALIFSVILNRHYSAIEMW